MVTSFGQMGLLVKEQGDVQKALDWTIRAVALFDEFPHPSTGPAPKYLLEFTQELGGVSILEERWQECMGVPLPDYVRIAFSSQE